MQAQDSMALAALAARNTIIKCTTGGEVAHGSEDKLLLMLDDQDRAQENGDTRSVYDITFADDQLQKCNGTDHGGTLRARKQQQQQQLLLLQKVVEMEKQKKTKKYELSEFHSLPDYLRDNEYILRHYRSDWPIPESLLSIFSIHNETLNIWTHLIGFLLFLALTIDAVHDVPRLEQLFEKASRLQQEVDEVVPILTQRVTRWPFFVFMGGSMFCLLSSSICHLLSCHSSYLTYWLLRLDYTGIGIMIATSFFPPVYYVFLCQPVWRQFYLTSISMIGVSTVIISLVPVFQTPKYRPVRGLAFASMAMSGIVPAAHKLMYFHHEPYCLHTLAYELTMGLFYMVGVIIYIARIPERWWPGLFDLAGHSHQIFHVLVVAGAFTHYKGGLLYLEWRDKISCL